MIYDVSISEGIAELGIFEKNKDAWVSSIDLSNRFGKDHKDVLRAINNTIDNLPEEFGQRNFAPSSYKTKQKKKQPMYLLTFKGFSLIAMGFTGKKALKFKVSYVNAFESMLSVITTRLLSKEGYKEQTGAISHNFNNPSPIDYSNEANMINKIILGMSAKDFNALNDTKDTRNSVVQSQLDKLDKAQRLNAQLINAKVSYDMRVKVLLRNFK